LPYRYCRNSADDKIIVSDPSTAAGIEWISYVSGHWSNNLLTVSVPEESKKAARIPSLQFRTSRMNVDFPEIATFGYCRTLRRKAKSLLRWCPNNV